MDDNMNLGCPCADRDTTIDSQSAWNQASEVTEAMAKDRAPSPQETKRDKYCPAGHISNPERKYSNSAMETDLLDDIGKYRKHSSTDEQTPPEDAKRGSWWQWSSHDTMNHSPSNLNTPKDDSKGVCVDGICYEMDKERSSPNRLYYVAKDGKGYPVTTRTWATTLASDGKMGSEARFLFKEVLQAAKFKGMFFETPAATYDSVDRDPFQFVLVNSPSLYSFGKQGADKRSFQEHFMAHPTERYGVAFDNLRKDARLISPKPRTKSIGAYAHLGVFVRSAPEVQVLEVLRMVASEYLTRLAVKSPHPVWLSTSGLGVAWLHFRLDSTPKYYQYRPFARFPSNRNRGPTNHQKRGYL